MNTGLATDSGAERNLSQGVVGTCPANEARGVARSSTTPPLASSTHTRSGVKCPVRASPPNGVIVTIGR